MTEKPKIPTDQERSAIEGEMNRLRIDIDDLEARWFALPKEMRDANQQLGRWFSDKARSVN